MTDKKNTLQACKTKCRYKQERYLYKQKLQQIEEIVTPLVLPCDYLETTNDDKDTQLCKSAHHNIAVLIKEILKDGE